VIGLGIALGAGTLVVYAYARTHASVDLRPRLAAIAAIGWTAIFVGGLGPLGSPPPWWFGPAPESWFAPAYQWGVPQALGLSLVVAGVLDAGALARRDATRA
jgi:hypothetical protein